MSEARPFDLRLLESARAGDRDAILSLLTAAQPDIRRYARRSCKVMEDADEAVQETLLVLYRRVGTLRMLDSFSGWLLAIVKRECLRLARLSAGWIPIERVQHEERFARMPMHELRLDLSHSIQSLPESYREIVLLRDIEELTIDAISGRLALSRETVKARLHRARKLMREYLQS
jgi:RNA polymerase sigma factor (sigma-70 family)